MRSKYFWCVVLSISSYGVFSQSHRYIIDRNMHHLRNGDSREWSEFPSEAGKQQLKLDFSFKGKPVESTLALRHIDVKQNWDVFVNQQKLGSLLADEQDMVVYYSVPAGVLKRGVNVLLIKCTSESVDDIEVGNIVLNMQPLAQVLSEASLELQVRDRSSGNPLPSRLTVVNTGGSLQTFSAPVQKHLAIRPGVAYTSNGTATLTLPAGNYRVYATRGFEYGVDSVDIALKPGDKFEKHLRIDREVDTEGWISSDTHIHTFTYSRHGDATMEERAVTIAGEGIELPVLTDHNVHVDIAPFAEMIDVHKYFTPVVGNELTTKVGHFNIFKVNPQNKIIDPNASDWDGIRKNIHDDAGTKAIILNHARDIHNGFRPFGPDRHLSSAGTSIDSKEFPANAMEVMNAGSQQTHLMNLFYDWFGMVNRGYHLTPVGSSDSHDVSRYIVGQGRTYIKGNDINPGKINIDSAIANFKRGHVMVSLGLLSKIVVNSRYGPGEMAESSEKISVAVDVWGPAWTKADHVSLYANGEKIKEEAIADNGKAGLKWTKTWEIDAPRHDVFLVAIAEGPGTRMPYWPIAKPYQPASPEWTPRLITSTGPVWIDADKNGVRNSAFYYATVVMDESEGSIEKMMEILHSYDRAVAIQAATLLWMHGKNLASAEITDALKTATEETRSGFTQVRKEIEGLGRERPGE